MDSLTLTPGRARLQSTSPTGRWAVLFEDEGPAGYCYACDTTFGWSDDGILDSMLIYNAGSLEDPTKERLASVQWSRSGLQAVFYLEGIPQAMMDFETRQSFCRSNFPNFLEQAESIWRAHDHAWDEVALSRFEADVYQ